MAVYIMKFYDRKNEIEILRENEKQASNSSVFTVLTGRRRVGKTFIIREFFKENIVKDC